MSFTSFVQANFSFNYIKYIVKLNDIVLLLITLLNYIITRRCRCRRRPRPRSRPRPRPRRGSCYITPTITTGIIRTENTFYNRFIQFPTLLSRVHFVLCISAAFNHIRKLQFFQIFQFFNFLIANIRCHSSRVPTIWKSIIKI